MKKLLFSAAVALMALSASAMGHPQVRHHLSVNDGSQALSRQLSAKGADSKDQVSGLKFQGSSFKFQGSGQQGAGSMHHAAAATGNTDLVQVPAGLQTSEFVVTAMSYAAMADISYSAQVGIDGNEMYIQGLFELLPEAWVKGTIEGDQVVFAPDQYVGQVHLTDQYDGSDMGYWDAWLAYTLDFDTYTSMTLSYDAEAGILSDEQGGLAFLALDDDFNVAEALAYLRLTDAGIYEEVSTELVTPPASMVPAGVEVSFTRLTTEVAETATGMMGFDGNDLYVLGLCPDFPSAWLKGTMDAEGVVTFKRDQYLGKYQGVFDIWFMGVDPNTNALTDVMAQWDADSKVLTVNDWYVENADPATLYYFDVFYNVTVSPLGEDKQLVIPPAGLQTSTFKTTCTSLAGYSYADDSYQVRIGFDGDDVYMQGLFYYLSASWIKGTRNADGSLTFAKNQYIGTLQGYDVYVVPCTDDETVLDTFTFLYEDGNYTYAERNTNLSFSIEPDCTDALEIIFGVEMVPMASADDYPIISEQPEGQLVNYLRSGDAYYTFFGYIIPESQNGMTMQMVYAPDGQTVYMKNPTAFGQTEGGSWVKGTIEGDKIHMPLHQCILFDEYEGYGYMTALLHLGQIEYYGEMMDTYLPDEEATEVTFTIHADGSISLDLESEMSDNGFASSIYGLVYTDDLMWAGFGDYNTRYTVFADEAKQMPEGLETEDWAYLYSDGSFTSAQLVKAAISDGKVYIEGLSENNPESVIIGQVEGNKVTFTSDQYVGNNDTHALYVTFATYEIEEAYDEDWGEFYLKYNYTYLPTCTFDYDAEKQVMRAADNVALILNGGAGVNGISEIKAGYEPRFSVKLDVAAKPANPEILSFGEYYEDYGYDALTCNVKMEDVDGRYLDVEKLYYTIWVKTADEVMPYTFVASEYFQFPELGIDELTEIPYNLVALDEASWEDIALGGSYICLYQSGFEDYGVQTIYYGGGERRTSDIVWLNGTTVGIGQLKAEEQSAEVYDLMGRKQAGIKQGLNLIMKDGKTMKVLR